MDWLWTWGGRCFGYRDGDDLWTYDGRHVGRFHDDEVYAPDGQYLGVNRCTPHFVCISVCKVQSMLSGLLDTASHVALGTNSLIAATSHSSGISVASAKKVSMC